MEPKVCAIRDSEVLVGGLFVLDAWSAAVLRKGFLEEERGPAGFCRVDVLTAMSVWYRRVAHIIMLLGMKVFLTGPS